MGTAIFIYVKYSQRRVGRKPFPGSSAPARALLRTPGPSPATLTERGGNGEVSGRASGRGRDALQAPTVRAECAAVPAGRSEGSAEPRAGQTDRGGASRARSRTDRKPRVEAGKPGVRAGRPRTGAEEPGSERTESPGSKGAGPGRPSQPRSGWAPRSLLTRSAAVARSAAPAVGSTWRWSRLKVTPSAGAALEPLRARAGPQRGGAAAGRGGAGGAGLVQERGGAKAGRGGAGAGAGRGRSGGAGPAPEGEVHADPEGTRGLRRREPRGRAVATPERGHQP